MFAILIHILNTIFRLCTNLTSLSLSLTADVDDNAFASFFEAVQHMHNGVSASPPTTPSIPPFPDPSLPVSRLRELHLGSEGLSFLPGLSEWCAQSLETLTLHRGRDPVVAGLPKIRITFPHLKWLRCIFDGTPRSGVELAERLEIPQLERLTVASNFPESGWPGALEGHVYPLIRGREKRLTYVCLVGRYKLSPGNGLEALFEMAPGLRHLVVSSDVLEDVGVLDGSSVSVPPHQALEHIDLWWRCTDIPTDDAGVTRRVARSKALESLVADAGKGKSPDSKLPSLKSVRVFDRGLLYTRASIDLPAVISPEVNWANNSIQHPGLFDIGIASDGKVIHRNDLSYVDGPLEWGEMLGSEETDADGADPWFHLGSDDSDEESEFTSDDSESESSTDSAEEAEKVVGPEGELPWWIMPR
ncbi:hypothetical protein V5O48_015600 [Marasmius crinis-equi]|uniref:Uncharacterized protein n=1 Tax=Marasmius crinis-equi TaxID=585013 RepID=A0ABR3EU34_9AGAR